MAVKPGRNELCFCGSGKKFKHCHGGLPAAVSSPQILSSQQIGALVALVNQDRLSEAEVQARSSLTRSSLTSHAAMKACAAAQGHSPYWSSAAWRTRRSFVTSASRGCSSSSGRSSEAAMTGCRCHQAATSCPSLPAKRVTPHVLRYTNAMLLQAERVDIATIALWLGHYAGDPVKRERGVRRSVGLSAGGGSGVVQSASRTSMPSAVAHRPAIPTMSGHSIAEPRRFSMPCSPVRSLRRNSQRCIRAPRKSARLRSQR